MTKSKPPRVIVPLAWFAGLTLPVPFMPEQGWEFIREQVPGFVFIIWVIAVVVLLFWWMGRFYNYAATKDSSHLVNADLSGCGTALIPLVGIIGIALTYYILFQSRFP